MNKDKELNLDDVKVLASYLLDNNMLRAKNKQKPVAFCLEAEAGVGKTSVLEEIANERGMTYVKLSLSELEEPGDLTGFPITEYLVKKKIGDNESKGWVNKTALDSFLAKGYTLTNKTRLAYAPPAWLPDYNPNGCILNLDDYSRASSVFLQATMELINTGRTVSWALPEGTTVALTTNPDNGEYNVTGMDNAQKTRFLNFRVGFDLDVWARWAEREELDNRAINFALASPEMFIKKNSKGQQILNARSYVTFCNAIAGIKDWESAKGLTLIRMITKGAFDDDNDSIGSLFTLFIENKLDRLISPKDMIYGDWGTVEKKLKENVYKEDKLQPAITSILATRLINYIDFVFSKGEPTKPVEERLIQLFDGGYRFFSEDNIFHVIKVLVTKYRGRCNTLIMNPKVQRILVNQK